jgi:tetratricopeptide (TPR) repeat protein
MDRGEKSARRCDADCGVAPRRPLRARGRCEGGTGARHFQQGDTYFKLDKYANALQEFEQAYLAKQDPSFLYNIAQCHRLMGNRVEAVRFYKRYITDAPNAANRPVAEKHIRDLESALGAEELTGPHVAPAAAPGGPAPASPGAMPPPSPTPAQPALALAAPPPPPPPSDAALGAPPPSPSDDQPIYTKWWFWTAVGGVVVAGIGHRAGAESRSVVSFR